MKATHYYRRGRRRFLLPAEWHRVQRVLALFPSKVRTYFTFLVLSAARRSEVRLMQWGHLDLESGLWRLPDTKSGEEQILPLPAPLCALLSAMPQSSRYVFPGETADHPWSCTAIEYWWRKVRRLAECPDVQIRDLRRTCASWMVMHGENLKAVQEVLRHQYLQTTQIYARFDLEAVRQAMTRHAARMLA